MGKNIWKRRDILKGISVLGAGLAGSAMLRSHRHAHANRASDKNSDDARFLIVLCATGGASIIDSVLAIRESESANAAQINCFPDSLVHNIADSPFRAVDYSSNSLGAIPMPFTANQSSFVNKHRHDMMVATWTRTSVNHVVAQRRAVTGNEAWRGRTLQEVHANTYGANSPLANIHLLSGSACAERGGDDSLPTYSYGEMVPDPSLWPLALHGSRGIKHPIDRGLLAKARRVREQHLDLQSRFHQAFGTSAKLEHWQALRDRQATIEDADLISKMMVFADSAEYPLSAHGLQSSPGAQAVRETFPDFASDPLEAQAALAFLLLKYRVSVAVTLGPSFNAVAAEDIDSTYGLPEGAIKNPPIAFDFSHQGHRATQAFMWNRVFRVADGLIDLLKSEEYANGDSLWDRSMIYIASDFGREKIRPSGAQEWGSGHDLNNGIIAISPLVRGNTVLGGVDPDTGMTYGFNPVTGAPEPGRNMSEKEIYAGLVQALGVDTSGSGLPDMPAMRRS